MSEIKVLSLDDREVILEYERANLKSTIENEDERRFFEWNAPWREESLEHYLKLGWSVGLWETSQTDTKEGFLGYFIGQVYLFHESMTQTLWIESLSAINQTAKEKLMDTAYRYAREKHLQRVIFPENLSGDLIGYETETLNTRPVVKTSKRMT